MAVTSETPHPSLLAPLPGLAHPARGGSQSVAPGSPPRLWCLCNRCTDPPPPLVASPTLFAGQWPQANLTSFLEPEDSAPHAKFTGKNWGEKRLSALCVCVLNVH